MFIDGPREQGLRNKLVEELRTKGIHDQRVLEAIRRVPRHAFLDSAFVVSAYEDKAFPIDEGQTMSQPYTVAYQTEWLDIRNRNEKILEIGTGSGYQTAILLEMGATVYTIERKRKLYEKAQENLGRLGYHPMFFYGDGWQGKEVYSPFDKIIITAGAPKIPVNLISQLRMDGGVMVVPVGEKTQRMNVITRISETEFLLEELKEFSFVPMLEGVD